MRALLVLALLSPATATHAAGLGGVDSVWHFESNMDESNGGSALLPTGFVPAYASESIAGGTANVLDLPALPASHWLEMPNGVGGNGGSVLGRTNEWTIAMDLNFAVLGGDAALLQTNPTNADDAEVHVTSAGAIEMGGIPIADPGTIQAGQWHRIVLTSEESGGNLELRAYVDGSQALLSGAPISVTKPFDGDYSLPATVPLFADDDAETLALKVNSLSYWGSTLTSTEIAALGTPVAPGYPDIYVINNSNSGAGSLRAALTDVRNGGIIYFDFGVSGQTITLGTGGQLLISSKTLVVEARHLASKPIINGADSFRIFEILSGSEITLRGLTMTNGNNTAGGGAVRNKGTLTIIECEITNSDSSTSEGGAAGGGGISNESSGSLTMVDSTIADNVSDAAGGIFNAGVATLKRCTISGNSAQTVGGIENINLTSLINCTVSGNSSTDGGGGGLSTLGTLTLICCTVSNNEAFDFFVGGGGVLVDFTATLNIENTIVAGNLSGAVGEENIGGFGGVINSTGFNLTSGDPLLDSLGEFGGPTHTMPPKIGSPAAATGIPLGSTPATDQRGFARINNLMDVGAVETPFDAETTLFGAWASNNIPQGQDRSFTGDPDDDLVQNGREYAFRLNPVVFDSLLQPRAFPFPPTGLGSDLRIVIPYNPTATDIVYVVEETTDLQNFTEIYRYTVETGTETISDGNLTTVVDPGSRTITMTDNALNPVSTFWRTGVIMVP